METVWTITVIYIGVIKRWMNQERTLRCIFRVHSIGFASMISSTQFEYRFLNLKESSASEYPLRSLFAVMYSSARTLTSASESRD